MANDGRTACPVKAVSHRRWGPKASLDRACRLAILGHRGPEWGQRAREAILFLLEKEQAERPHITIVRHGLAIFDALGVDQIGSVRYNAELKRLKFENFSDLS